MSRKVTVSFEALDLVNQVTCEYAIESLSKIDEMVMHLDEISNEIGKDKCSEYRKYLLAQRERIRRKMAKVRAPFEQHRHLKTKKFDLDINYGNKRSKELAGIYNELEEINYDIESDILNYTCVDIQLIYSLLENGIYNDGLEQVKKALETNPRMNIPDIIEKIEKAKEIKDVPLRELVYRELLKPASMYTKFENIVGKAERRISKLLVKGIEETKKECKRMEEENNIDAQFTNEYYTGEGIVEDMYVETIRRIIEERTRNATIKAIVKAIRETGFVIDSKNSIKIDRRRNVVKMLAKKPSGQLAEFEVQLDGKFMYHFEGYEGGTCSNDIEPFLQVLEDIYGIHIVKEKVHYDEPLKELKHRQYFEDSNKGKQTQD